MSGRPRAPIATVGALVVRPDGRVLVVRTYKWRGMWGVPGGKIAYGESMLAALRRELREETMLEVHDVRWGPVQEAVESPEFHEPRHFILLNFIARTDGESVTLDREAEEHAWVTPGDALDLDLNTPTRRLVTWYRTHGFGGDPVVEEA